MKLLTLALLLSLSACTNVSCRDVNCDGYVDVEFREENVNDNSNN